MCCQRDYGQTPDGWIITLRSAASYSCLDEGPGPSSGTCMERLPGFQVKAFPLEWMHNFVVSRPKEFAWWLSASHSRELLELG